ncbi:MAG: hypothetical protein WC700_16290 [Gemmatimonadaceae bacterium]|jgi:hypothetical protein
MTLPKMLIRQSTHRPGAPLDMSAVLEPRERVPPALRWLLALALLIWLASAASC